MTIIEVGDIEFQANSGYDDPSLPIRIWRSSVEVTGDASGGNRIVQINLKAAGVPPGNVFSLEQLAAQDTDGDDLLDIRMSTAGFEVWAPFLQSRDWAIPMALASLSTTLWVRMEHASPHLFIGRGADAGTAAALSFQKSNALAEEFEVHVSGYMWSPRSISTGGGFRRPSDGQYSR